MKAAHRIAISYTRVKFKLLSAISKKKAAAAAFALFCTPQSRHKKKLSPVFEQAEKLYFRFQGNRIRGYRWNNTGKRKVLILHGFESSVLNFEKYIQPLIKKGYQVLAFDAPAHGHSSGKKINALIYRDLIRDIHERYGPVESSIAHSFGGLALAMAMAEIRHTDQYRLALIAPATETATAVNYFLQFIHLEDAAVREAFEQIIFSISGQPLSWFSIRRAIADIHAKILWVHDEDDGVTPLKDALTIKEQNHPGIQFVITKGLGHRRIYRDGKVIKTVIDFI